MSIEAMKQALELAKKLDRDLSVGTWELAEVMAQLEQAIAEMEQDEPEAWMLVRGAFKFPSRFPVDQNEVDAGWTGYALYTHPQPRKPLTDEQILSFVKAAPALDAAEDEWLYVARAIESAHDIKE